MLHDNFVEEKKAQVGETMTWFVATVIIIVILVISILIVGGAGFFEEVSNAVFGSEKDSHYLKGFDRFAEKSFNSYLLTGPTYESIKTRGNLDTTSGPLARNIFEKLYDGEYSLIWMGVGKPGNGVSPFYSLKLGYTWRNIEGTENEFFGDKPNDILIGGQGRPVIRYSISSVRSIGQNEYMNLAFTEVLE